MAFKAKVEDYEVGRTIGEGAFGKVKSKYFRKSCGDVLTLDVACFDSCSE